MRISRLLSLGAIILIMPVLIFRSASAQEEQPAPQNPVALFLSETLGIPYDDVIALQQSGVGLGNIGRAHSLALETGVDFMDVLMARAMGMSWGQLFKDAGLNPGGFGLGRLFARGPGGGESPSVEWSGGPPEGTGPPDQAGPPENAGPKEGGKAPDHAGPPDHAGDRKSVV